MEQRREEIQERVKIMEVEQIKIQEQLKDGSADGQEAGPGDGDGVGVGRTESQSVDIKGSVQRVGGR